MTFRAQAERLEALEEEERGEGAHARAEVAHDDFAADHRVRGRAERCAEDAPVVAWRGLCEGGEFRGRGPVEFACRERGMSMILGEGCGGEVDTGVDDYAPDCGAVAPDPFRRAVHWCEDS